MFQAESLVNPRFGFSTAAGRYVVLSFLGSAKTGAGAEIARVMFANADVFKDPEHYLFLVTSDSADRGNRGMLKRRPGMDVFWDESRHIAGLYGAAAPVTF